MDPNKSENHPDKVDKLIVKRNTRNLVSNMKSEATTNEDPLDIKLENEENTFENHLDLPSDQETLEFSGLYICNICGVRCENELSQKIHIQVHADANEIFPCTICNIHFDEKSLLDKHVANAHKTLKITSSDEESNDESSDAEEQRSIENIETLKTGSSKSLSEASRERYVIGYNAFIEWRNTQKSKLLNESLLLLYFNDLAKKMKPSTLKSHYFMLKNTIQANDGVDISNYPILNGFLKQQSDGFISEQSKVFTSKEIEKFLNEAPDSHYLAVKVCLIFGFIGACRCDELLNITVDDLEDNGSMLLVTVQPQGNRKQRLFTVEGEFYNIYKKYAALRPDDAKTNRFFMKFTHGKYTNSVIGKNKFGSMPREIAEFLNLPDIESYTGNTFRQTSAKLLADSGADIRTLKLHGGWRSKHIAGFIKEAENKVKRRLEPVTTRLPTTETVSLNKKISHKTPEPVTKTILLNKSVPNKLIRSELLSPPAKRPRIENQIPSHSKPSISVPPTLTPPPLTPITSTSSASAPKPCVALINGNNFKITPTSQHIFNFHNCQITIVLKK